ncbi:MAG: ABC transporter substrate-binding protein [Actinomycetota bacterium]
MPDNVKKAGVIRVATDPSYPPFTSIAGDGKTVVGFDADMAHAIAETLGLKIEFVPTSFDAIIPALSAGKVDMAMSSIGDTKKREVVVDYATYYWNGTLMVVPVGNPKDIKANMACGARIGVIRGSLQQSTFLPSQAPACKQAGQAAPIGKAYQTGPQAQLALSSGRIDGVMEDAPTVLDVVKKQPATFSSAGPLTRNPNPGGVAFPKGSKLADPVSKAINALIKNGAYHDTLDTWNLSAILIETSQINGAVS